MEFAVKRDIAAPVDTVFAALTDFSAFERQVLRRGAELRRRDTPPVQGAGASWDAQFQFRNKQRKLRVTITDYRAPEALGAKGESAPLHFTLSVELMPLSGGQTRLKGKLSLAPQTFGARLMIQSLKLARATTQRRIENRLAAFAAEVESRHARPSPAP